MAVLDTAADDFRIAPLSYPGTAPGQSSFLSEQMHFEMRPQPGKSLAEAEVLLPDGTASTLNIALLNADVEPAEQRAVVVSVGSNSSLAVMHRKFSKGGVSTTLPVFEGTVTGISVGHSAHVSAPGYIAAAPLAEDAARTTIYAALLDAEQIRCLDETEPNYAHVLLDREQYNLTLGTTEPSAVGAEIPDEFHLYVSIHGLITPPQCQPLRLGTQDEVFRMLAAECEPFGALFAGWEPADIANKLAQDQELRDTVRLLLITAGWVSPDGIPDSRLPAQNR